MESGRGTKSHSGCDSTACLRVVCIYFQALLTPCISRLASLARNTLFSTLRLLPIVPPLPCSRFSLYGPRNPPRHELPSGWQRISTCLLSKEEPPRSIVFEEARLSRNQIGETDLGGQLHKAYSDAAVAMTAMVLVGLDVRVHLKTDDRWIPRQRIELPVPQTANGLLMLPAVKNDEVTQSETLSRINVSVGRSPKSFSITSGSAIAMLRSSFQPLTQDSTTNRANHAGNYPLQIKQQQRRRSWDLERARTHKRRGMVWAFVEDENCQ